MLPNRPPARNGSAKPVVSANAAPSTRSAQRRRRGAMMALAAMVGTPANLWTTLARAAEPAVSPRPVAPAAAADETFRPAAAPRPLVGVVPALLAQQPKAGDSDLLRQAQDQYAKRQYEEALATLQQVKADGLSAEDRRVYDTAIKDAESAANERKAARAAFEQGQAALDQKNSAEAAKYFQAAASNNFADAAWPVLSVKVRL